MKFRYIITALILALAVSCQSEKIGVLSEIQVSESYVSLDVNGGSASLELTAASSWSVDETSVPEWLTVSPMSGSAGENIVLSFTAAATKSTQNAEVRIVCGVQTQYVNVIQYAQKADPVLLSVSEALALIKTVDKGDGQNYNLDGEYYVKGIVCRITEISPSYGNATYYLSDDGTFGDGNWLQVYRGYWYNGGNFTSEDAFSLGDELTICGQLMSYKGTPETVEKTAYVVELKKSLIKVASVDPEDGVIPSEGGSVTVTLDNKGNGLYVEVPDEAKSWLSISSIGGSSVTFTAAENNASPRMADLVFSTVDGGDTYTASVSISQDGAAGTFDLPFSATEAIKYAKAQGGTTANDYWVKGIVSKIANNGEFGEQYGNGTFWISEDGEYHDDLDQDFEAYQVYWFDNEKWVKGNAQIAVGAEVLLCGKLTVYGSTAETASRSAYVYSVNGVTTDAEGIGTPEDPFTAKGAIAAAQAVGEAGSSFNAYIKGIISSIVDGGEFGSYGNATFWISGDGVFYNDKSVDFEAYRVYWLGNRKWEAGDPQIAVGDEVILHGPVTLYKDTAETVQNKAYIYSHNGKTE